MKNVVLGIAGLSLLLGCSSGPPPQPDEPAPVVVPEPAEPSSPAPDTTPEPTPAPAAKPATPKALVEAYFAAIEAGDKEAVYALMTPEWAEKAKTWKKSFTFVIFEMGFKVKSWELKADPEESGDTAKAGVRAVFIDDKGKDDKEGMRFELVRKDGSWLIAAVE